MGEEWMDGERTDGKKRDEKDRWMMGKRWMIGEGLMM